MGHLTRAYPHPDVNRFEQIAWTEAYAGGYRMLREQTDWNFYNSLGVPDLYGGPSGTGHGKYINLDIIKRSYEEVQQLYAKGKLSAEGRDELSYRKPMLLKFLSTIIDWCEKNGKDKVFIFFG